MEPAFAAVIISLIALAVYVLSVGQAIYYQVWTRDPSQFPQRTATLVSGLAGVLAANFGATVGIQVATTLRLIAEPQPLMWLRWTAVSLYLVSLIASWVVLSFLKDPGAKQIPELNELAKMLIGILVGGLLVGLSVQA